MEREAAALHFAAHWHNGQCRKGRNAEPFLRHPLRVAQHLLRHDLIDSTLICAALLHDVLEDSACPPGDIEREFGPEVLRIVRELTDDKSLLKSLRKQYQVERAELLSPKARLIRLADKIDNVASLADDPPADWSHQRRRDYIAWSRRVVKALRSTHPGLEADFDQACERSAECGMRNAE